MTDALLDRFVSIESGSPTFRLFVCGNGGSGKSTMARAIASAFRARSVEIDALRWTPQWTLRPVEEVLELLEAATTEARWVVEDGSVRWVRLLSSRADLIVWLDPPLAGCLARVVWRSVLRWGSRYPASRDREPLRLSWRHWQWCWRYRGERRPAHLDLARRASDRVVHLTRWRDIRRLARALEASRDRILPARRDNRTTAS